MTNTKIEIQILKLLDELKGRDIVLLDVRKLWSLSDWMIIVTGSSARQIKAMHDALVSLSKNLKLHIVGVEGRQSYEWLLVDFGDVVVHLMREEARNFYELDKLWSTEIGLEEVLPDSDETANSINH